MQANGSDALAYAVDVGAANEFVDYVHDLVADPSLADLDPINQLIMLEEMDEYEAYCFVLDLHHRSNRT